jgi:predicted RNA-binding Zn ribbon-like protein
LGAFLERWGLGRFLDGASPPIPALKELRGAVRLGVERVVAGDTPGEALRSELDRHMSVAPVVHHLRRTDDDSGAWELGVDPARPGSEALLGTLAHAAARFFIEIDPARLRICPNGDCGWVFYDETRNRTRKWCSSTSCGNITKVRQYRERQKSRSTPTS